MTGTDIRVRRVYDTPSGRAELARPGRHEAVERLRAKATASGPLTLLTATRDPDISQAAVLAELLRQST